MRPQPLSCAKPAPAWGRLAWGLALCLGGGLVGPVPARAAGSLVLVDAAPASTTRAAGLSVWSLPTYPGAASRQVTVLPGVDLYGASGWFVSTDNGVGWNLSRRADVQAGVRLWPQFGRAGADAPRGLLPVGDRLQAQVFANQAVLPALLLQSAVAHGAGRHHDGTQAELGLTTGVPWGPNLLGLSLAATWANAAFRQSLLGVSEAESVASGLPATPLAGGWQDASLAWSAEVHLDERWRVSGQWLRARWLGAAARSPVVAARWQSSGSLSLWRAF